MADDIMQALMARMVNLPDLPPKPDLAPPVSLPSNPTNRGLELEDPADRFSGKYDEHLVADIIRAAKKAGIDAHTALAMGLQESTLGRRDNVNPMSLIWHEPSEAPWEEAIGWPNAAARPSTLDASMKKLKQLQGYLPDDSPEDLKIQSYNGLGPVPAGSYGNPEKQSGRDDRPYGNRVIDLRETVIRPNQRIQEMIRRLVGG